MAVKCFFVIVGRLLTYTDEQTIRDLIANWQEATRAGDLPLLLSLTAEDVVFLTPGQPPMRGRDAFAAAVETALQHFHIESRAQIEEIQIAADLAYCWSYLSVTLKPLPNGSPERRAGYALTILRRQPDGSWVVSRDANMLIAEP